MGGLIGTVAVTDQDWYAFLLTRSGLDEVNFWKPSPRRTFIAPAFSPFFFKLRAPHNAVCGFGYYAQFAPLPAWLAWETFGEGNGCATFAEMEARIHRIRRRMGYEDDLRSDHIGCILLVQPIFFAREDWVRQPEDWPVRTLGDKKYDLTSGEGSRVWRECLERVASRTRQVESQVSVVAERGPRYGAPTRVMPRLGQGTFRIAVTEAYRACAVTEEHSLPVLDAAHIQPYVSGGAHDVSNGLLLRADLHRLFDKAI
jgi:putative restriction endonuclease